MGKRKAVLRVAGGSPRGSGGGDHSRVAGRAGHPWPAAVEQGCSTLPDAADAMAIAALPSASEPRGISG